ncbi:hypothetical protein MTO96_018713 [Rhipicephalus appendiculatus]
MSSPPIQNPGPKPKRKRCRRGKRHPSKPKDKVVDPTTTMFVTPPTGNQGKPPPPPPRDGTVKQPGPPQPGGPKTWVNVVQQNSQVESSEDEQGEVLPAFVQKECEEPATPCSTTLAEQAVEPNAKVESTEEDEQVEVLHGTVEECQFGEPVTSAKKFPSLVHHDVAPSSRVFFFFFLRL